MNDNEISQLGLIPWKKKKVSLDVPQSFAEQQASEFRDGFRQVNIEVPSRIAFEVEPALQTRYGSVLRVQDYMVLRILNANKWRKPIYFAVTVAKSNMLSELQQYMRMDGLAYKLVPYKNWNISPENLRRNLNSVYKYRGLQDSTVHYDKNIQGLLQNYRTAYLQLIEYHARTNQRQEISVLLEQMEERVPSEVIPWTNRYLRLLRDSYELTTGTNSTDSLVTKQYSEQELLMMGENMYRLNMFPQARDIFVNVYEGNPNNIQALSLLISVLERMGDYRNGISYLETWVKRNPRDANAIQKLASFKEKL
jgi:tetratricopeptide (TPR) repeat protein